VLALEEPYRETVLLRYFENLPPRAIARRLAVPVETVRTRLKRALETLRARLDRDYGARGAWSLALVPFARAPLSPAPLVRLAESIPAVLSPLVVMSTQAKLAGAVGVALIAMWLLRGRGASVPRWNEPATSAAVALQPPRRSPRRSSRPPRRPRRNGAPVAPKPAPRARRRGRGPCACACRGSTVARRRGSASPCVNWSVA
jgi:hypothetical protein